MSSDLKLSQYDQKAHALNYYACCTKKSLSFPASLGRSLEQMITKITRKMSGPNAVHKALSQIVKVTVPYPILSGLAYPVANFLLGGTTYKA